jgi:hypothetical protein
VYKSDELLYFHCVAFTLVLPGRPKGLLTGDDRDKQQSYTQIALRLMSFKPIYATHDRQNKLGRVKEII